MFRNQEVAKDNLVIAPPHVNEVAAPNDRGSHPEIVNGAKNPGLATIGIATLPISLVVKEGQTATVRVPIGTVDARKAVIEVVDQEEELASASSSIPEGSQRDLFNAIEGMASNAFGSVASR